jgi:hypothetical protein
MAAVKVIPKNFCRDTVSNKILLNSEYHHFFANRLFFFLNREWTPASLQQEKGGVATWEGKWGAKHRRTAWVVQCPSG